MWRRMIGLFRRRRLDQDLDDEIRLHLEMLTEEYVARGFSVREARERARRDFGGIGQTKEAYRDLRGIPFLESCVQDLRLGMRTLLKNRSFSAVALLTLAIGIGANTAMFTVLNAVILQPLSFPNPERLMVLLSSYENGAKTFYSAPGVYVDWRERSTSFEHIEGIAGTGMILSGQGQPRQIVVNQVSAGFFDVIGVRPILGRVFDPEEDNPGRGVSVLLDAGFWHREFGGKRNVLGQRIILDEKPYIIAGVMPAEIRIADPGQADVWIPLQPNRKYRTGGNVIALGHLKPGITREAAQAEMDSIMRGIGREHVEDSRTGVQIKPLQEWITAEARHMLQLSAGAAAFVFLICCANVANLMMARSTTRRRELAVRASLGAGKVRLARHLASESLILALTGGVAGVAIAASIVRLIPAIKSLYIPRADEIAVDWRLFLIAVLTTAIATLVFGIVPAWQAVSGQIAHALQSDSSGRTGKLNTRDFLVVGQFAMALMLLTGAGMLMKSLWTLLTVDTGFERDRVVTIRAVLPYKKYDEARGRDFYARLAAEVGRLPGVRMIAATDYEPLQAVLFPYDLFAESGNRKTEALGRHVGPAYFDVLGIPVLAGRALEAADDNRIPIPVLVNRKLAQALFPDSDPIGKLMKSRMQRNKSFQIVGVTAETRQIRLAEAPGPQFYLPVSRGYPHCLIAKVAPQAGDLTGAIRHTVQKLDPEVPAPGVSSVQANFDREIAKPRFYTLLLGSFAAVGVLLAAVGIYGVTSFAVSRRTHEFGIRMAVGARPADIIRLVLSAGARLAVAGALIGLAGAFAVTRMLASSLYGTRANDAGTIAGVLLLLITVGLAACCLPARRGARVNPSVALRAD